MWRARRAVPQAHQSPRLAERWSNLSSCDSSHCLTFGALLELALGAPGASLVEAHAWASIAIDARQGCAQGLARRGFAVLGAVV